VRAAFFILTLFLGFMGRELRFKPRCARARGAHLILRRGPDITAGAWCQPKIGRVNTIVFPGHMTVSGVVLCWFLAGLAGRPDMKNYWQNNEPNVGLATGPPDWACYPYLRVCRDA
jgi:hypothetical protein